MTSEAYALTVAESVQASGLGRSFIYEAIQRGELPIKKAGRRTLILRDDLVAWLHSLPNGNARSKPRRSATA